jgi:hypothetical protein
MTAAGQPGFLQTPLWIICVHFRKSDGFVEQQHGEEAYTRLVACTCTTRGAWTTTPSGSWTCKACVNGLTLSITLSTIRAAMGHL